MAAVDAAGQSAVAAVLRKPVNLKLPNATVGAKRKRPVEAAAEGADPELTSGELIAAYKKAQAAFDAATALAATDASQLERAQRRYETEFDRYCRSCDVLHQDPLLPSDAFERREEWLKHFRQKQRERVEREKQRGAIDGDRSL